MENNQLELNLRQQIRLDVFKYISGKYDIEKTNQMINDIHLITDAIFNDKAVNEK